MLKREDIRIRDPFIITDKKNGCYYMYGTTALKPGTLAATNTFSVYKSYDLENFEEPKVIFDGGKYGFWANRDFWAPEVHVYNGKYYLFGSCKADGKCRATQIFVCDTPDGEFVPIAENPPTPADWECLDGTFYIEDGVPYIVFCHEWVQIKDGTICAQRLSDDLTTPIGEPIYLFKATDNEEVTELPKHDGCYVTDGPFFFMENGKPVMIWSSYTNGRYQVFEAESDNGKLNGNWTHKGGRFNFDGGHAMIFETLEGKRMISLHSPNKADLERAMFLEF